MDLSEAGRKGGLITASKRTHEEWAAMSRKGIEAKRAKGIKFGRPPGCINKKNRLSESPKKIMSCSEGGRIGGNTTKNRYGESYYKDIGIKGGEAAKELIELGKLVKSGKIKIDV